MVNVVSISNGSKAALAKCLLKRTWNAFNWIHDAAIILKLQGPADRALKTCGKLPPHLSQILIQFFVYSSWCSGKPMCARRFGNASLRHNCEQMHFTQQLIWYARRLTQHYRLTLLLSGGSANKSWATSDNQFLSSSVLAIKWENQLSLTDYSRWQNQWNDFNDIIGQS